MEGIAIGGFQFAERVRLLLLCHHAIWKEDLEYSALVQTIVYSFPVLMICIGSPADPHVCAFLQACTTLQIIYGSGKYGTISI